MSSFASLMCARNRFAAGGRELQAGSLLSPDPPFPFVILPQSPSGISLGVRMGTELNSPARSRGFEKLAQCLASTKSPAGMKARSGIGISIVIAFFTALTIASSPRLHEKLHKVDSQHACAATMIASGNCEHTAPPQLVPKLENAPNSPAFLPKRFQFVVASVPSSVQEHAPPIAP